MAGVTYQTGGVPEDLEAAAKALFAYRQARDARWSGLQWDGLLEGTKRLFRREASWMNTHR